VEGLQDGEFVLGEAQCAGGHVRGQVIRVAGTGDGQYMRPAVQRPRQPYLRRARPVRPRDGKHLVAVGATRARLAPAPAIA